MDMKQCECVLSFFMVIKMMLRWLRRFSMDESGCMSPLREGKDDVVESRVLALSLSGVCRKWREVVYPSIFSVVYLVDESEDRLMLLFQWLCGTW